MLKNKTKNSIVSKEIKILSGVFKKGVGLIGKKPEAVILYTRFGVHTFGMKYPLDIIILDNKLKVVRFKENLMPNRIFLWNPIYKTVIELKGGTVKNSKTQINDVLEVKL